MSEFSLSDRMSEEQDFSDENPEFNGYYGFDKNLKCALTGITINRNLLNNNSFEMNSSSISNKEKSMISVSDEEYYKKNEQIDEVKYNIFMMMNNDCRLSDKYKNFIQNNNFILRRLIKQKYTIENKILIPGEKYYSFISKINSPQDFKFNIENELIEIDTSRKEKVIKINNIKQNYKNEEEFKDEFGINIEKKEKEIIIMKDKSVIDNQYDIKTNEGENSVKSIKSNISYKKNDSYEEGFAGYKYYDVDKSIRYLFFNDYKKEIDGVYTQHREINLNKKGLIKIDFNNLYPNDAYDNNNDLMANIIFKNFVQDKIETDAPFILEIKKSFKLYELLQQIKQDAKILANLQDTSLPEYIIGILCNYPKNKNEFEREKQILNQNHYKDVNNISELSHIIKIINKFNIKVIVCVIKNEQINNYPLGIEDYNIEALNLKYRVDLEYMHNCIYNKEINEDILNDLKSEIKYRSITSQLKPDNNNLNIENKVSEDIEKYKAEIEIIKNKIKESEKKFEEREEFYEKKSEESKVFYEKKIEENKLFYERKVKEKENLLITILLILLFLFILIYL